MTVGGIIMGDSQMHEYEVCSKCGEGMWNGMCENRDCEYHWYPKTEDKEKEDEAFFHRRWKYE